MLVFMSTRLFLLVVELSEKQNQTSKTFKNKLTLFTIKNKQAKMFMIELLMRYKVLLMSVHACYLE